MTNDFTGEDKDDVAAFANLNSNNGADNKYGGTDVNIVDYEDTVVNANEDLGNAA